MFHNLLHCQAMYKRVLLKLSGEQLAGRYDGGIDAELGGWIAREVKKAQDLGAQVMIMVGGGNYARGAQLAGHGIKRVTADQVGMLATMMNALALTDIFEAQGIKTRCLTSIFAQQVAEPFVHRLANKHLDKGRVVIVGGGSGRPYVTTDTAALIMALELDCDVVLKATKVDGVYNKDPAQFDDATKVDSMSFQQAVEDGAIKIMDKAAMALAMEHRLPIIVFDSLKEDNIQKVIAGEPIGTTIS